jgi:hypothetical protein
LNLFATVPITTLLPFTTLFPFTTTQPSFNHPFLSSLQHRGKASDQPDKGLVKTLSKAQVPQTWHTTKRMKLTGVWRLSNGQIDLLQYRHER